MILPGLAPMCVGGGLLPLAFTFVGSASGTGGTIDYTAIFPSGPQASDVAIIFLIGANTSGAPLIIPQNITQLTTGTLGNCRHRLVGRKMTGGETTSSITGTGNSYNRWIAAAFRPNRPWTGSLNYTQSISTITDSNPSAGTISASSQPTPLIAFGHMGAGTSGGGVINPRITSPTMNEIAGAGTNHYAHYLVYNPGDTPADITYDMDDEGVCNSLAGGYLTFPET